MAFGLQIPEGRSSFVSCYSPILSEFPFAIPEKPDFDNYCKTKNQVMKKIRLMLHDENAQARVVIIGFVMVFALLFIFFF
jgi:Holliday junction resolvase RusA-like endonuclease